MGGQIGNSTGVVTNFGSTINVPGFGFVNPLNSAQWNTPGSPTRRAYDLAVRAEDSQSTSGWIWYQHWWTENLRSTIETSGIWNSVNTTLLGQGTTNNKLLAIAHVNLMWSPVAFVDFGAEYGWGHRVTVANFKGDAYEILGTMRVRF
jgi:DcaP outer membrane protein